MPDKVDAILQQWARERPDLDVSSMALLGRLARVRRITAGAMFDNYRKHGLKDGEFDLLATLRRSGTPYALTPGQLVETSMVTSGAITNRLDRLEARGLVTRETDPANRRSVIVTLTDEGKRVIDAAVTDHVAVQHALLAPLSDRDRQQLTRLLTRWLADLGDLEQSSGGKPDTYE